MALPCAPADEAHPEAELVCDVRGQSLLGSGEREGLVRGTWGSSLQCNVCFDLSVECYFAIKSSLKCCRNYVT